ncbi:MAG: SPOR domain-containing protein [Bacteroidales bacterium]
MRKNFLIFPVILCFTLKSFSQADVSISCQDQWGPGRYNKVSVSISFKAEGFARFTQDFPVGFDVTESDSQGCDISWTGSQLNVVLMDVRPGKPAEFSYFIKPESNMNGTFNLQGEVVIISGGTTRYAVRLQDRSIEIGGTNGVLPAEMKDRSLLPGAIPAVKTDYREVSSFSAKAVFRVQVSASSKVITEARLRKEMDLSNDIRISIIRSGNTYKYQAGEYSDYESAEGLLKKLKEKGIKGAFIVAWLKGEQVDVDKARKAR